MIFRGGNILMCRHYSTKKDISLSEPAGTVVHPNLKNSRPKKL